MPIDLYIYSGLGNIIAIIDSLRNDISINSEDVLKIYQNHKIDFMYLIIQKILIIFLVFLTNLRRYYG